MVCTRYIMVMDSSISSQNNDTTEKSPTLETVTDDAKDIISSLHESTLGHILSFLPTIEAVHTCLLSRNWINVWNSITSLWFNDTFLCYGKRMQKEQFVHFVNKVFLQLSNSSIQNFSLFLTAYQYDSSQVSEWISSILQRGVQKLHIQHADKVFLCCHDLFNCTSLVQLVLQMRCTLSVPIFACLPNLQNLSISGMRLVSDLSTYSQDLTLSFPLLKVFEARGCEWSTMQDISIQAPLLEKFSIAIWNSMSNESSKCKSSIKVFAPHLKDFSYEGDLEQDIVLSNPSSVLSASVVIVVDEDRKDRMEKLGSQAHKFLSQIHEVEQLKLLFYKVLIHAKDIFTHLPAFGRLTYLQLNEVTGEALLNLLHNSPILNTLVLLNGVSDLNTDVLASASVPHCFLSSLKFFQFKGFNAHEHEICLAKFVMANAAVLERMTIFTAFWLRYSDIDMEKVKEKMLSFPKCSSFAIVEFSDVNGSSRC